METQYDLEFLTDAWSDDSWFISPEVIDAFEGAGLAPGRGIASFILIALSAEVVRDGPVEADLMGVCLKIERRGPDIYIDLL